MKNFHFLAITFLLCAISSFSYSQKIIEEYPGSIKGPENKDNAYTTVGSIENNFYYTSEVYMAPKLLNYCVDGKIVKKLGQKYNDGKNTYFLDDFRIEGELIKGIAHIGGFNENQWSTFTFTLDKELNMIEQPQFVATHKTSKDLNMVDDLNSFSVSHKSNQEKISPNNRYVFYSKSGAEKNNSFAYYYVYDRHQGTVSNIHTNRSSERGYYEQNIPLAVLNSGEVYVLKQTITTLDNKGAYQKVFLISTESTEKLIVEGLELYSKYDYIKKIIALHELTAKNEQVFVSYSVNNQHGSLNIYKYNLETEQVLANEYPLFTTYDRFHIDGTIIQSKVFSDGTIAILLSTYIGHGPYNLILINQEGEVIFEKMIDIKPGYFGKRLSGFIFYEDKKNEKHLLFNAKKSLIPRELIDNEPTWDILKNKEITTVDLKVNLDKGGYSIKPTILSNGYPGAFLISEAISIDENSIFKIPVKFNEAYRSVIIDFAK